MIDKKLKILAEIDDGTYITKLFKNTNTDISYSHLVKSITELEKLGLVETEKKGRVAIIRLTNNGKKVKELIKELEVILNENRMDWIRKGKTIRK